MAGRAAHLGNLGLPIVDHITGERAADPKQLQLLIDSMPMAIVAVNRRRQIRLVSRSMAALFGYEAEELLGHKIDTLVYTPNSSRTLPQGRWRRTSTSWV